MKQAHGPVTITDGEPDWGRLAFVDRIVGWRRDRLAGISVPGALVAMLAYVGAYTPSLLPRPWHLQGLISALCGIAGYVVGVGLGGLGQRIAGWAGLEIRIRLGAQRVLVGAWLLILALGVLAFPFTTMEWQQSMWRYVGLEPPGVSFLVGSSIVAIIVFALVLGMWRFVAGLVDWFTVRLEPRFVREALARVVATVMVIVLVGVFIDQIVLRGLMVFADRNANAVNATRPQGLTPPASPLRSGGPGSHEAWETLGQDGAIFVSSGPSRTDIAQVTKRAAAEPIRVFAGAQSGRSLDEITAAVLAEMDRTRAFERSRILVVTATSTGFINEWSASAFEYLGGGDTVVVSMQYSTLPSAFDLLTSADQAPSAGRHLFDAVSGRIAALPANRRPKLYVGGESLGAYGGHGAFADADDMLAKVDGAVWSGTPAFTAIHQELTARRTPGSTQVNPVVDNGRQVRFAGRPAELTADQYGRPLGSWGYPRIVYLQHDSDPVAWWSPDLLFQTPDWLRETRSGVPMGQMSWSPLVTFWQVTADMAMSNNVPGGFGHRYYETETVPAWAAVLGRDVPPVDRDAVIARIAASTR